VNLVSLQTLAWTGATVAVYWALPRAMRHYAVAAATAVFLAVWSPLSLLVLASFTAVSYIPLNYGRQRLAGALVSAGAVGAAFVWLKSGVSFGGPLVPMGLGFYTLRAIHYSFDSIKGTLPRHGFGEFLAYMFFLPTLVAGPINRFQEFHRNLGRARFDSSLFSKGCERVLYGFVKVAVLANYEVSHILSVRVEALRASHDVLAAYLDCVRFALNLYFQFSGYSDFAIGFAMLLGYRIAENFNYPFLALNIGDFWRRWHISLSNWCRDYIYVMGLSVWRRPWAAVLASMLVLGVWHELSYRYLAWGVYHGAGIALWQGFQRVKPALPGFGSAGGRYIAGAASYLLTMNFVILSFAITKEPDLFSGLALIGKILFFWV